MLDGTLTHYYPWNEPDDVAWCGAMVSEADHSLTPTCPTCAAKLAIEDDLAARLADEALIEMTDDDARYAGETVAPSVRALTVADSLFAYAVALTRLNTARVQNRGRR